MSGNFAFNVSRAVGAHLTTTAETTVYTAKQYVQVVNIHCANTSAASATVTVKWYDSSLADSFVLLNAAPVAANDALHLIVEAFGIASADEIRITAGTANVIDVTLTVVELPGRSG